MTNSISLDVHAHFTLPSTPEQAAADLRRMHAENFTVGHAYSWAPERELDHMDDAGVGMQLLNNINVERADDVRRSNDFGAGVVRSRPSRFGFLASLPMLEPDLALTEIARASSDLDADGFALRSSYQGHYLGHERFAPIWRELDRRHATVFLHPDPHLANPTSLPTPLLEVTFDTARTVADLIFAGFFRRHHGVRIVLAHAGGALPTLAGRIGTTLGLDWVPNPENITGLELRRALAGLYYDTALSGTSHSLGPVLDVTSPDHIVYGSDTGAPCTDYDVLDDNARHVFELPSLTPEQRRRIATNAEALFPRAVRRLAAFDIDTGDHNDPR